MSSLFRAFGTRFRRFALPGRASGAPSFELRPVGQPGPGEARQATAAPTAGERAGTGCVRDVLGAIGDGDVLVRAIGVATRASVELQLRGLGPARRRDSLRSPYCLGYVLGTVTEYLTLSRLLAPEHVHAALRAAFAQLHGPEGTELLTIALAGLGARHESVLSGAVAGRLDVRAWEGNGADGHRLADALRAG